MSVLMLASLLLTILAGSETPAERAESLRHSSSVALQKFVAVDLAGQQWSAERLRGRVVLIDFWATWCAPCLAEIPRLKALRSKHSREDFEILGISLDARSRQSFVSWLNRNRVEWPQVHQRAGYSSDAARVFGIDRLPRTIVIDRDGSVAAVDVRGERLALLVDALVAGRINPLVWEPCAISPRYSFESCR